MTKVTPFGMTIRRLRLERHEKLGDMADELDVTSSYLSAVEHGLKKINAAMIKKVCNYFNNEHLPLEKWKELAEDSQPAMKLNLDTNRDLKLTFGRSVDNLPLATLNQLRKLLEDDNSAEKKM